MKFKFDILFQQAMSYFTTNPYCMTADKVQKMNQINTLVRGRFKYFVQFMQQSWLKDKISNMQQPKIQWQFLPSFQQPARIKDNTLIFNKEFLSIHDLFLQLNDVAIQNLAQYIAENLFSHYDRKYQKIYPLILKFLQDPTSQQPQFIDIKKQLLDFNKHNNQLYMLFQQEK